MGLHPVLALLVALLVGVGTPAAAPAQDGTPPALAPAATPTADRPLDLPAITLTPADLEAAGLPGFGLTAARGIESLAAAAAGAADARGGPAAANLSRFTRLLEDAGWRGGYRATLAAPQAGDPTRFAATVETSVEAFASDEGAAEVLAAFSDPAAFGLLEAEEIPDPPAVGDEARLLRFRGRDATTGQPFQGLGLGFRAGGLVLGVAVYDWSDEAPDPALVEALAVRLRERAGDGGPGLSPRALRLAGDAVVPANDRYAYLDGAPVLTYGEVVAAAEAAATPAVGTPPPAVEAAMIATPGAAPISADVYDAYALVGDPEAGFVPDYRIQLGRFADAAEASAGLAGYRAELDDYAGFDGVAPAAAAAGDESFTVAWTARIEGATLRGYGSYVRVGAEVATIYVTAPLTAPPLAVIEELTRAQVACLRTEGVCAPVPAPAALLPGAAAATPIAAAVGAGAGTPAPGRRPSSPGASPTREHARIAPRARGATSGSCPGCRPTTRTRRWRSRAGSRPGRAPSSRSWSGSTARPRSARPASPTTWTAWAGSAPTA